MWLHLDDNTEHCANYINPMTQQYCKVSFGNTSHVKQRTILPLAKARQPHEAFLLQPDITVLFSLKARSLPSKPFHPSSNEAESAS